MGFETCGPNEVMVVSGKYFTYLWFLHEMHQIAPRHHAFYACSNFELMLFTTQMSKMSVTDAHQ